MRNDYPFILAVFGVVSVCCGQVVCGQGAIERGEDENVSPVELLDLARGAFQRGDFVKAEEVFARFFADYGENPEAVEALDIHRPFLALSKIGVGKYEEALELINDSLQYAKLEAKLEDELSFWRGICLLQAENYPAAQEAMGEYWSNEKHEPFKRYEALLLFAGLYLLQGFDEFAADFLKDQIPGMRKQAPEAASRAVVLRLHALMKAGMNDQALMLLRSEYSSLDQMTQVVSFQMQVMELGARFIEEKQYRKALFCLQRVWSKEKLLKHQGTRLIGLRERAARLEKNGERQAVMFQIKSIIRRIEREISQLELAENFNSGLRLRVAIAYQTQGRYREAALVMEAMLRQMPADRVVDSASVALVQCWMQIERWPKVIEAADLYREKFTLWEGAGHLPEVMFLKAEAYREMKQTQLAAAAYGELVEKFPDHEQAPAALFMQAYMYLIQDDSEGAVYHFDQLRAQYAGHNLIADADYWTGMALSFTSEYAEARAWMQAYLAKHDSAKKPAKYKVEARFRLAYCAFALGESEEAIEQFVGFTEENADHVLIDEAWLLLGDAYLGEGEIDRGIATYRRVSPIAKRFFEDAWFKLGKALRLTDRLVEMRAHFAKFLALYPDSNRMPEAVYWVGWVDRQSGEVAKAKQIYWQVLKQHGNDAKLLAIEDLIAALPMLYRETGAGEQELLKRLQQLRVAAVARGRRVMALRCAWGVAQIYRQGNKKAYQVALLDVTPEVDAKQDAPRITLDCADAQLAMGNYHVAGELYEEVRKWHPRAAGRDRVFAGLGRIAEQAGEVKKAIGFYERFERETASPQRLAEVKLDRARLLVSEKRADEAMGVLNELLENQHASSQIKAQALFEFGELLMSAGEPRKAAAYYERIYVVYGKYRKLVARAYLRRGEALEELALHAEALEVYEELAGRTDLHAFDEFKKAEKKLLEFNRPEGVAL
ncbi:MAG: tetratricopeptide repeat protein [Verrucomicrobia bacterium]|nr:tetratricopeptide repeat protein [Verrucomicrobiota bacterium]